MIQGNVITVTCAGCQRSIQAGTIPYLPANGRGVLSMPEQVYKRGDTDETYSEACAKRIVEAEDPTRSVSRYYADTTGLVRDF